MLKKEVILILLTISIAACDTPTEKRETLVKTETSPLSDSTHLENNCLPQTLNNKTSLTKPDSSSLRDLRDSIIIHKSDIKHLEFLGHYEKDSLKAILQLDTSSTHLHDDYANHLMHFSTSDWIKQYYDLNKEEKLIVMAGDGFENVAHIITIWQNQNDSLQLKFIFPKIYYIGIGSLWIDKVYNISDKENLVIINSAGGDAGETWGVLTVLIWNIIENSTTQIYEDYWQGGDVLSDYEFSVDSLNRRLEIHQITRSFEDTTSTSDTIFY